MEEQFLIQEIINRNKVVFDFIFHYYYSGLCVFCERMTKSQEVAEDIVQELFVTLWLKNNQLHITTSLKQYLFSSVKNRSLDYLKHKQRKSVRLNRMAEQSVPDENLSTLWFAESELKEVVDKCLDKLPPRCREIFLLSRIEGLKNQEIADQLNISKRTVELQVSNALRLLRTEMAAYLPLQVLMFLLK